MLGHLYKILILYSKMCIIENALTQSWASVCSMRATRATRRAWEAATLVLVGGWLVAYSLTLERSRWEIPGCIHPSDHLIGTQHVWSGDSMVCIYHSRFTNSAQHLLMQMISRWWKNARRALKRQLCTLNITRSMKCVSTHMYVHDEGVDMHDWYVEVSWMVIDTEFGIMNSSTIIVMKVRVSVMPQAGLIPVTPQNTVDVRSHRCSYQIHVAEFAQNITSP